MGELSEKFPDDNDVATLYAESMMNLRPRRLYTKDGTPEAGTDAIVAALEGVMLLVARLYWLLKNVGNPRSLFG